MRELDFRLEPQEQEWVGGQPLPIWDQIGKTLGLPDLIVIPAFNPNEKSRQPGETSDPLDTTLCPRHFAIEEIPAAYFAKDRKTPRPLAELLSDALFAADHPPRFVLVVGEIEWILIDRFKWPANRFLRFDLTEILGQKPAATLNACVALLHREALCPDAGEGLLDTLDAESHKHDAGVSEDLKLFDPASTLLLNRVRFPNHLWQAVLRGLSFAKDPKTRRTRRVSYQALSINQLGAV